ncbi:MAG TPA: 50S ribosomal protein L10 [Acidimicrobiia bacterium]|nr:50S ribosomal protein L10 [Acidimicrobiia bacterium]
MARPEKVATVEEIKGKLEEARAAVLTEYRGLKVSELAELRASLRAAEAEYKVYKNTLARRAAEEAGLSDLISLLEGPTAITFVKGDAVTVAKALRDYARGNPNLVVKGGILGTRVIAPDDVVALADIQPREVLLARLAGGFQAPLVKAAGLFQAFTRNMAYGIKALIDQRVAAGESAEAPAAEAEAPAAEAEAPAAEAAEAPAEAPAAEAEAPAAEAAEAPAAPSAEVAEVAEVPAAEAEAPAAAAAEPSAAEAAVPAADAEAPAAEAEAPAAEAEAPAAEAEAEAPAAEGDATPEAT